jgi:hypothetical protein
MFEKIPLVRKLMQSGFLTSWYILKATELFVELIGVSTMLEFEAVAACESVRAPNTLNHSDVSPTTFVDVRLGPEFQLMATSNLVR